MRTVTIIETGAVPEALRAVHGTYPAMFARALGAGRNDVAFRVVDAASCAYPALGEVEAVLITGSPAGVYDDRPWIAPLEGFVRAVHAARIPLVGVCFGHQVIAQALGGEVRKSDRGWGLGRHVYKVVDPAGLLPGPAVALACSHQDQVVRPPPDARVVLASAFTPYAGLLYGNGSTLSVQAHPEFTPAYAAALCRLRAGQLPAEAIDAATESLARPLDSAVLNEALLRFLLAPPVAQAAA